MRSPLVLPVTLLALAGFAAFAVRSDAQVAAADLALVKEFVTTGTKNVTTSSSTLLTAPANRVTYVTDLVIDNRNAFDVVVQFTRNATEDLVSLSVPADDTRSLHFQTGFELVATDTLRASATGNVKVTANAFRVKE